MKDPRIPAYLTGFHAEKYHEKLLQLHKGACSSPRKMEDTCPCTMDCPLHGRCCDCVAHHITEIQSKKNEEPKGYGWLPTCLRQICKGNKGELRDDESAMQTRGE